MKIIWRGQAKPDDPTYKTGLVVSGRQTKRPSQGSSQEETPIFLTPSQAKELGIPDTLVISPAAKARTKKSKLRLAVLLDRIAPASQLACADAKLLAHQRIGHSQFVRPS